MYFKSRHSLICPMYSSWEWRALAPESKPFHSGKSVLLMNKKGEKFLQGGGHGFSLHPSNPTRGPSWKIPSWVMSGVLSFCHPQWILFLTSELLMESNRRAWRSCAPARQGPGMKVFMDKMYVLLVEQRALPITQHEVMQGWSSIEWIADTTGYSCLPFFLGNWTQIWFMYLMSVCFRGRWALL